MESKRKVITLFIIIIGITMTLFPPYMVEVYSADRSNALFDKNVEYRFIFWEDELYDASYRTFSTYDNISLMYDRLLLQYLVLGGIWYFFIVLIRDRPTKLLE